MAPSARRTALHKFVREWAERNPRSLLKFAGALTSDRMKPEFAGMVVDYFAEKALFAEAMEALGLVAHAKERPQFIERIARAYAGGELEPGVAWVAAFADSADQDAALGGLATRVAKQHGPEALRQFVHLGSSEAQAKLAREIGRAEARAEVFNSDVLMKYAPPLWENISKGIVETLPIEQVATFDPRISEDPDAVERNRAYARHVHALISRGANVAAEWAATVPPASDRLSPLNTAFAHWARVDPKALEEWLKGVEDPEVRDAALDQLAFHVGASNSAKGEEYLRGISKEANRKIARRGMEQNRTLQSEHK